LVNDSPGPDRLLPISLRPGPRTPANLLGLGESQRNSGTLTLENDRNS